MEKITWYDKIVEYVPVLDMHESMRRNFLKVVLESGIVVGIVYLYQKQEITWQEMAGLLALFGVFEFVLDPFVSVILLGEPNVPYISVDQANDYVNKHKQTTNNINV